MLIKVHGDQSNETNNETNVEISSPLNRSCLTFPNTSVRLHH